MNRTNLLPASRGSLFAIQNALPSHCSATFSSEFLPFFEFNQLFRLVGTSTEQSNQVTKNLSQIMHKSITSGMKLLLNADQAVVEGLDRFTSSIALLAPKLAEKIKKGGRVFVVGSGTSGRISLDLAAKCRDMFPETGKQVRGIIAGGDSVMIRAKEKFEDSEADGEIVLKEFRLDANDSVILLSASGSASFNVGCGHFAANQGAQVFYFYNSEEVPQRTQNLFHRVNNSITPLCVDIGPQAITGSTRLQAASLAEACLGSLLTSALYLCNDLESSTTAFPLSLSRNIQNGMELLECHLDDVAKFAKIESEIFSHRDSNFRQMRDISDRGYVTILSKKDSAREVLIDATELPPTYATSLIRKEGEAYRKRPEFQSYLFGAGNNATAWKVLLGRDINPRDVRDAEAFLLAKEENGINSHARRPTGAGNFSIGVIKLDDGEIVPNDLLQALADAKQKGGHTGMIVLCRGKMDHSQTQKLKGQNDACVILENIPHDAAGISETILLKQVLNLISNSSMVLMNKVYGNQMIDVNASNQKLIGRCLRLTKAIWKELQPGITYSDELCYYYITSVSALTKEREARGIYTPSVVKIVLTMLATEKTPADFQEAVDHLLRYKEKINWIGA